MVVALALLGGMGLGWILSWLLVVRPLQATLVDMRYAGFVRDAPPPRKLPPRPEVAERNET
jgi:hypothetical protein